MRIIFGKKIIYQENPLERGRISLDLFNMLERVNENSRPILRLCLRKEVSVRHHFKNILSEKNPSNREIFKIIDEFCLECSRLDWRSFSKEKIEEYLDIIRNLEVYANILVPWVLSICKECNDKFVQHVAIRTLGKIGTVESSALDALACLLSDLSENRDSVLDSIADFGALSYQLLPIVLQLAQDVDPGIRRSAAHALGRIGKSDTAAINQIAVLMEDKNQKVRAEACEAAYEIVHRKKIQSSKLSGKFYKLLSDEIDNTVITSLEALSKMTKKKHSYVKRALALLDHPNRRVCLEAIELLGAMGSISTSALPSLEKKLNDEDTMIAAGAADAIERILKP